MKYLCHDNLETINKIIQNLRKVFHVHACFLHSNSFNASFWVKICILQLFTFNFSTPPNYRLLNFDPTKKFNEQQRSLVSRFNPFDIESTWNFINTLLDALRPKKSFWKQFFLKEIGGDSCFISWLTFCARYGI